MNGSSTRCTRCSPMPAKALMIQGTGSSVGKSLLTTALCRIFTQDGYRVLPFKAQNMSNNSAVTGDGGELGRAQAEQAGACKAELSVLMNPILLKPTTDTGAQVIVLGKTIGTMDALAYQKLKPTLCATITESLTALRDQAEILVIEGAGSPAEINLKAHDFVNMWVAKRASAAVLLVGDIDRGGVFAQLVGTMELLDEDERCLVRGFLINKFRGELNLLEPGLRWLETRFSLPVLGTIPYFDGVEIAEEDAAGRRHPMTSMAQGHLRIDVIQLPRISNFTDFDAVKSEPGVRLRLIERPGEGPLPDCIMIPGTKSTIADLAWLRERGFEPYLRRCVEAGSELIGICGGFQMLCREILDPDQAESPVRAAPGFGLLPGTIVFEKEKITTQVQGFHRPSRMPVGGYEIHNGRLRPDPGMEPLFRFEQRIAPWGPCDDGLASPDGRVWGTHLHGIFDEPRFRSWWVNRLRQRAGFSESGEAASAAQQDPYDWLAQAVSPYLNVSKLSLLPRLF